MATHGEFSHSTWWFPTAMLVITRPGTSHKIPLNHHYTTIFPWFSHGFPRVFLGFSYGLRQVFHGWCDAPGRQWARHHPGPGGVFEANPTGAAGLATSICLETWMQSSMLENAGWWWLEYDIYIAIYIYICLFLYMIFVFPYIGTVVIPIDSIDSYFSMVLKPPTWMLFFIGPVQLKQHFLGGQFLVTELGVSNPEVGNQESMLSDFRICRYCCCPFDK